MNAYEEDRQRILNRIGTQKSIHKFRNFMYSLVKDQRRIVFDTCLDFFNYEYANKVDIKASEHEYLRSLMNHFQWNNFENDSMNWWSILSHNHVNCETLHIVINECISGWNGMEATTVIVDNQSIGAR